MEAARAADARRPGMIFVAKMFSVAFVTGLAWSTFSCIALGRRPGPITVAGFYGTVALSSVAFAYWVTTP